MKLWILFCLTEFCISIFILHKAVTSSFEDRVWKPQDNCVTRGSETETEKYRNPGQGEGLVLWLLSEAQPHVYSYTPISENFPLLRNTSCSFFKGLMKAKDDCALWLRWLPLKNKDLTGYDCSDNSDIQLMPRHDSPPSQTTTVTDGPLGRGSCEIFGEAQVKECVHTASLEGGQAAPPFQHSQQFTVKYDREWALFQDQTEVLGENRNSRAAWASWLWGLPFPYLQMSGIRKPALFFCLDWGAFTKYFPGQRTAWTLLPLPRSARDLLKTPLPCVLMMTIDSF